MDIQPSTTPQPAAESALEPTIIVIFGITGDLAKRYLLPSLYHLIKQGLLHEKTEIIGTSRHDVDLDDLFSTVELCVSESDNVCDPAVMARMRQRCRMQRLDTGDENAYCGLRTVLDQIEADNGVCTNRLYYLAIPPAAYTAVIGYMGAAKLNESCQHGSAQTRLLVEKPFGHDLASAKELIIATSSIFSEEQLYRIDHYLAKETAQNILAFRFENPLFEAVWDNSLVVGIDIVASEKISIEGRAEFYEQQGALRDVIQNHLLQLLAVVTMDKPATMSSEAIHSAKLALLQAVKPITDDGIASHTKRGQYEGYLQEVKNDQSHVETYAFIETIIDTPRWQGVPVTIRTGKSLAEKHTSITITFADKPGEHQRTEVNNLRFRIQPDEGIQVGLLAKKPGYDQALQPVTMNFAYHQNFNDTEPTAYERVLVDAVRGDRTLFASSDEVLAAWQIIDDVVQAWTKSGEGLFSYTPGTAIDDLSETISEQGN